MSINVLVTGANGQVASCIRELYEENNDGIRFKFVSKKELDISSKNEIADFFKAHDFQFCINCAAYTDVDGAEDDRETAFLINGTAVGYLSEACHDNKVVLIHLSTDYIFDGNKKEAYTTLDQPNPINVYGASKLEGELKIKEHLSDYYIIRASWLYSDHGKNFLKTIMKKVRSDEELNVVNTQSGAPTNCYDLARFIYYIIHTGNLDFGIYHFGTLNHTNWFEFARHIASHFPKYKLSKIKAVSSYPSKARRPKNSVLSIKDLQAHYNQLNTWQNSLDQLIEKILSDE